jgi:four helix bundle protein
MPDSYRDLRVWQQAMKLAVRIYRETEAFPKHELYSLTAQLRRAAVSVPSKIAEGKGRRTDPDFLNFLFHARGSLLELETQVSLAQQLGYLAEFSAKSLLRDTAGIGSALTGLIHSLKAVGCAKTAASGR